jgi:hypothetical protein
MAREAATCIREGVGRIPARRGAGPRVNDHPFLRAIHAGRVEQRLHGAARLVADAQRQPLVVDAAADRGDEIELPAHLMTHEGLGFRVRDPVREELVRVLVTVRKAERDLGEKAQHGRRERVLAVRREDHGTVEASLTQSLDHRVIGLAGRTTRGGLQPRRVVDHDVVDLLDEACRLRSDGRREQRQMPVRLRALQRPQRGRRHEHVAHGVEPHAQDATGRRPRHQAIRASTERSRMRAMILVVDRSSTYGRMRTTPPSAVTSDASGSMSAV